MKKILFTVFVIVFISKTFSQITLEHTYNYATISTGSSKSEYLGLFKLSIGGKYTYADNNMSKLYLYNLDHSTYKQINIQQPTGFSTVRNLGIYNVSDNLFNNDSKVEYLIVYSVSGDSINPTTNRNIVFIYNEDGVQLFRKEYSTIIDTDNGQYTSYIQNTPNGTKMILTNQNTDYNVIGFSVYSLPGNLLTLIEKEKTTPETKSYLSNPFPNPANEYAAVFYKLPELKKQGNIIIYDINGKQVQNIKIDGTNEYILFNNTNLNNGTYFYSLIVDNEILDSKKMIITR